jgi:hypothetical protein
MYKKCTDCSEQKKLDDFNTRIINDKACYKYKCKLCEILPIRSKRGTRKCRICKQQFNKLDKKDKCDNCLEKQKAVLNNLKNGFKKCTKCLHLKSVEEFGIRTYENYESCRSACKNCEYLYNKQKRNEVYYKLITNLRNRLYQAVVLKSIKKSDKTLNLIGTSSNHIRNWLEYQFNSKMNWNNYGSYWVIDHVIPCNSFNLEMKNEQQKCFHWTNLRPLSNEENSKKSDKILPHIILLHEIKVHYYKKFSLND